MRIEVVTLFPELVAGAAAHGVTGRARERGLWTLGTTSPRDFATDRHRSVDDRPYGGGPGMVMLAAPLDQAIGAARELSPWRRSLAWLSLPAATRASTKGCLSARWIWSWRSAISSSRAASCRRCC